MRTVYYALIPVLMTLFHPAVAQDLDSIFRGRSEVYFSFRISSAKDIHDLTKIVSIDRVDGLNVYAYANRKEFPVFLQTGLPYQLLTYPGSQSRVQMRGKVNLREITDWDFYPTYDAYVDLMHQFQNDYPALCKLVEIGTLSSGRKLLAVKISDNVNTREAEPQFLYSSSMHGNEITGYVLMLHLIDYLLSNYGTDPQVTFLIDNVEIWACPLANPDGTYAGGNNTVNGATRGNANGVDLNRNYPDPEDGPHPDGNPWQQETIAFMNLADANDFVMGVNFHDGAELVNYPWDTWAKLTADDNWWNFVSFEYADTVHAYSDNYFYGQGTGVTNGYAWYEVNGGRQDYMNWFHYCRECTIELYNGNLMPGSQLPTYWGYNYRSFLNYIAESTYGIRGVVTDSLAGEPIRAKVFIEGHDFDSSQVYSSLPMGNYHRLLYAGTYDVTYKAWGYFPKTIDNVEVVNRIATNLDIELVPGNLIADFYAASTTVPAGTGVNFFDQSYGNVISWNWTFDGGTPPASQEQNPLVHYDTPGVFDVSLTVSDGTLSNTMTKTGYISVNLEYLMTNTTITTCSGIFFDSGGQNGNYNNNENFTMTFLPGEPDHKLVFEFYQFNVEYQSSCIYDWLKIYDGADVAAPLIGTYCGTDSPGTVVATNEEGALTFSFHSDWSQTMTGWAANIHCDDHTGMSPPESAGEWILFPNPTTGIINIIPPAPVTGKIVVAVWNGTGQTVYRDEYTASADRQTATLNLSGIPSGVYMIVLSSANGTQSARIVLDHEPLLH